MSISVCIVDDDELSLRDIETALRKVPELVITATETEPIVAVSKILSGAINVDIVFTDLEMPDITGIELCKQIGNRAVTIFVTNHPGFALDAYDTDAADFLTKPINPKYLIRALQKAKEKLLARSKLFQPSAEKFIFLKLSHRNVSRIHLNDILYVDVDGKQINLHVLNQKPIPLKRSLNAIAEQLPTDLFMKISKSCIVNVNRISSIVHNQLVLDTGSIHTVGSTFLNEVYARYDSL